VEEELELQVGVVETERRGDVVVLRLRGEHDIASKSPLADALADCAWEGSGVVVSLVKTQFVDSSVINVLFQADAQLRERGRRLVLHVATESVVRRVLDLTQLSSRLPTTGSLEEALVLAARVETG
jgi:anti-anti-sigma factor